MPSRLCLHEATIESKRRLLDVTGKINAALAGVSKQDGINALSLLLVIAAIREGMSFSQLFVALRANWTSFGGTAGSLNEAIAAAREVGLVDVERELATPRAMRELRGDLRHMRRRRGN